MIGSTHKNGTASSLGMRGCSRTIEWTDGILIIFNETRHRFHRSYTVLLGGGYNVLTFHPLVTQKCLRVFQANSCEFRSLLLLNSSVYEIMGETRLLAMLNERAGFHNEQFCNF